MAVLSYELKSDFLFFLIEFFQRLWFWAFGLHFRVVSVDDEQEIFVSCHRFCFRLCWLLRKRQQRQFKKTILVSQVNYTEIGIYLSRLFLFFKRLFLFIDIHRGLQQNEHWETQVKGKASRTLHKCRIQDRRSHTIGGYSRITITNA